MADLSIQYDEEMVGAGHPTKEDTLNRLVLAEHNSDGSHKCTPAAYVVGCGVYPASVSSLTIRSGKVNIAGTDYQIPAALTKSGLTGLDADSVYRVEATAPSSGDITASEIAVTTSSHAWSQTHHCLMRSSARLLGLFATDGSGNIRPHTLDGQAIWWPDPAQLLSLTSSVGSATALNILALGEFDTLAFFRAEMSLSSAVQWVFHLGSDGSNDNKVLAQGGSIGAGASPCEMSNAGQVYYRLQTNAGTGQVDLYQTGLALPPGLGR